ncbi:MAG: type VI secretion system lipoprotein TssJ [Pseudomonadota bacterium]
MAITWIKTAAALVFLAVLGACAEPPAPPAPTTVALSVTTDASANSGLPSRVQVYYLSSVASFQGGDYFALADDAQTTLGADLVAVDEYLMIAGTSETASKSFDQQVTHIGVVVGFREIGTAAWRATLPLTANAPNPVAVTVSGNTVTLAAAP